MSLVDKIKQFLESKGAKLSIYRIDEGVPFKGINFTYDFSTNSHDWITEFANKFEDIDYILSPQSMTIIGISKGHQYKKYHKENPEVMKEFNKIRSVI